MQEVHFLIRLPLGTAAVELGFMLGGSKDGIIGMRYVGRRPHASQ